MEHITRKVLLLTKDWTFESTIIQRVGRLKAYDRDAVLIAIENALKDGLLEVRFKSHGLTGKEYYEFKRVSDQPPIAPLKPDRYTDYL